MDAKAENDALRDDVAAGRRRLRYQSSLSVSAWPFWPLRRGRACSLPPTGDTVELIISPWREAGSLCKNNWKEPVEVLMSSVDRVGPSMGNSCNYVLTHALPAEYSNVKVIKPSNPFTNVCWVSVLTTFSAPPQILAARTVSFCPIPETKK